MFWWTKKDWEIKILNDRISTLTDRFDKMQKNINKLERILKNIKHEPTFRFLHTVYVSALDRTARHITNVRLYIECEEYDIGLTELWGGSNYDTFVVGESKLRVEDNIATIICDVVKGENIVQYAFYIDYKRGTYICRKMEKENEPKTEK
jgi:hypothetical protein